MIATLTGTIAEKLADIVVLDVHGVGYALFITPDDYGLLNVDQTVKLYIYEYIREQNHDLFGFLLIDTKTLFEQLLAVNGVGPKMALSILSIGNSSAVRSAIASGNAKSIQQAPGVGKRLAERIIVELKDKVGLDGVDLTTSGLLQSNKFLLKDEAIEALVMLGYTTNDAASALQHIDTTLTTEERVKKALKGAVS